MRNQEYKKRLAALAFLATTAFGAGGFEQSRPPVGVKVENLASSRTQEFAVVDNRPWKRPIGTTRWEPIDPPFETGFAYRFHAIGDTVMLVQGNKASVSLDNGATWAPIGFPPGEIRLEYAGPDGLVCTEYVGVGTNHHTVHFSKDLGATWHKPILIPEEPVSAVVWKGAIFVSLSDHGALRIDPVTGESAPYQTGLPDTLRVELRTDGKGLLAHAMVENRAYRYSDSANIWEQVFHGPQDELRISPRMNGGKAFLWSYDGSEVALHHSADGGVTWVGGRLAGVGNLLDILPEGEGYLASTTDKGIYRLDGQLNILGTENEGLARMTFSDLHVAGSRIFATAISDGGNLQSTDLGKTWTLAGRRNYDGIRMGDELVTLGGATYLKVQDSLKNISDTGLGTPSFRIIQSWKSWFVDAGSRIYMQGDEFTSRTPRKSFLYASVKGSGVWSDRMGFPIQIVNTFAAEGEDVMASGGSEAYISRDAGRTWFVMPPGPFNSITKVVRFGNNWVASTNLGFFTADIAAKTWSPYASFDGSFRIAATSGNRMVVYGGSGQARYTQDAGATWSTLALPFQPLGPLFFALSDKVACAAKYDATGVLFAETWCAEVGGLPLSIRPSSWKRIEAPRSSLIFSGTRMIVGPGFPGATYTIDGGRIRP